MKRKLHNILVLLVLLMFVANKLAIITLQRVVANFVGK
jgi:hypothetical protein